MKYISPNASNPPSDLPVVVKPNFSNPLDHITAGRSLEDVVDIVFRVLCGYESVSEICLREGVRPEEYYRWHDNFAEISRLWARQRLESDLRPAADRPNKSAAETPAPMNASCAPWGAAAGEDITEWAQGRLATAWRADYQALRIATY
jgi:hypothetical protein